MSVFQTEERITTYVFFVLLSIGVQNTFVKPRLSGTEEGTSERS